jgi:hypothetical protein
MTQRRLRILVYRRLFSNTLWDLGHDAELLQPHPKFGAPDPLSPESEPAPA